MTTLTPASLRLFVCVAVSTFAASAYLAPVEERCGVRVEIAQLHGYASDDYLSNYIIGGRNPAISHTPYPLLHISR